MNHFYPDNTWEHEISDNRRKAASDIYEKRKGNNQDPAYHRIANILTMKDLLKKSDDSW